MPRPSALIVHGMGDTPMMMLPLAGAVRRAGVRTHFFQYFVGWESIGHIVSRLKRALLERRPQYLITHSLGGILMRLALAELPPWGVRHLVMLGTPYRPPRLAKWFGRFRPYSWAFGTCGRFLANPDDFARLPPIPVPFTVVAGTFGPVGPLSPFGRDPNDGVVSVCETKIDDAHEPVRVAAWHTLLMAHPGVHRLLTDLLTKS
jgi:hypothetical protein